MKIKHDLDIKSCETLYTDIKRSCITDFTDIMFIDRIFVGSLAFVIYNDHANSKDIDNIVIKIELIRIDNNDDIKFYGVGLESLNKFNLNYSVDTFKRYIIRTIKHMIKKYDKKYPQYNFKMRANQELREGEGA